MKNIEETHNATMDALWFVVTSSCVVLPIDSYESQKELTNATLAINRLFPKMPYRYARIHISELALPVESQLAPAVETSLVDD